MVDSHDGHVDHDPMLIAALLDGDLAGFERTAGESRIASCPDCATLHDDLLALSIATRALPIPPRPRDFTLTAADVARLTAPIAGEPRGPTARLAGVMTDPRASASHASHDTMLVASLADHSLAPSERTAAEALVAACGPCADIYNDLLALQSATKAMPTPTRPRDYALTPDDAVRLRPGGWRRFVAAFGTSRDMLSRPLAVGLTTLGLAGLLVATIPSVLPGQATSSVPTEPSALSAAGQGGPVTVEGAPGAGQDTSGQGPAAALPSGAPASGDALAPVYDTVASPAPVVAAPSGRIGSALSDGVTPTPGLGAITNGSGKGQVAAPGQPSTLTASTATDLTADSTGISTLVILSGAFLIAGLGLFAIRWTARRLGD